MLKSRLVYAAISFFLFDGGLSSSTPEANYVEQGNTDGGFVLIINSMGYLTDLEGSRIDLDSLSTPKAWQDDRFTLNILIAADSDAAINTFRLVMKRISLVKPHRKVKLGLLGSHSSTDADFPHRDGRGY